MTHDEYQQAAYYWKEKEANSVKLEKEDLLDAVEEYINKNNTCALATGTGDFIRCTPIEYTYYNRVFWMFSEGGEKFISLEHNKNICLAIFDKYEGFGRIKGMQVTGRAELIEPFLTEYNKLAEFKNIPLDTLKNLPEPMKLLKVIPERIEFLNSDFKKKGFSNRQVIVF